MSLLNKTKKVIIFLIKKLYSILYFHIFFKKKIEEPKTFLLKKIKNKKNQLSIEEKKIS